METASPSEGMNGTRIKSTLDGRCVNTIVLSRPMRFPSQPAAIDDAACSSPATKNTRPMTSADVWNLVMNQYTTNVLTTNPPPKESTAKSAESCATVRRDRTNGNRLPGVSSSPRSIAGESRSARNPAITPTTVSHFFSAPMPIDMRLPNALSPGQ